LNVRLAGFLIIGVRPDIPNVRIGEADNLAGVTWVSKNFLIASEACIKNNFSAAAGSGPGGAP
jgi:hypothetical protein